MRLSTLCISLLVISAAPTARLIAQSAVPVNVGERVRITTPAQRGAYRYVGRVVQVQGDSVTVRTSDSASRPVAIAQITKLEVSAGKHGNGWRGTGYGTLIGIGAGAALGAATYTKSDCAGTTWFCGDTGRGGDALAGGILGGLLGAGIGGLWGALHPTERWVARPLGSGTRVGITPSAHGTTLRLALRF
jgi:hypothetical protein